MLETERYSLTFDFLDLGLPDFSGYLWQWDKSLEVQEFRRVACQKKIAIVECRSVGGARFPAADNAQRGIFSPPRPIFAEPWCGSAEAMCIIHNQTLKWQQ
jgi:hypothetical protein